MPTAYTEADYENSVMELFGGLGYEIVYGPDIERDQRSPLYDEVLEDYLRRLNAKLPEDALADALYKLRNFDNGELVSRNEVFMDYLQNGIPVRYTVKGEERSDIAYLVDYQNPANNSFIAANQWTYIENSQKRPDVVLLLLNLAKQISEAQKEGQQLGLTADELAFYDALTKPQAIKDFYENEELIAITKELADTLRRNRTIDWQKRSSARARMRLLIKKLLKKHKYPPEGMDDAVQTVMLQCELWTDNYADVKYAYESVWEQAAESRTGYMDKT